MSVSGRNPREARPGPYTKIHHLANVGHIKCESFEILVDPIGNSGLVSSAVVARQGVVLLEEVAAVRCGQRVCMTDQKVRQ